MGRFLIGVVLLAFVLVGFGFLAGRAFDYEQFDHRLVQLEVHDCGLMQFEDYSMKFQRDDATRFRCAAAMQETKP